MLPESKEQDAASQQEPERQKSEGMSQLRLRIRAGNQMQGPRKKEADAGVRKIDGITS